MCIALVSVTVLVRWVRHAVPMLATAWPIGVCLLVCMTVGMVLITNGLLINP